MHKTSSGTSHEPGFVYRERLGPSLWLLVGTAVCAPMAALVFVPIDTTLSLVAGVVVGVGVAWMLIAGSPVIEVRDGWLRAGRARIDTAYLGAAVAVTGESAREGRGPSLNPRAWHVIRGGIDGLVTVEVIDPDDPTPAWVMCSRTPDRLVAAIRRTQVTPRTPRR